MQHYEDSFITLLREQVQDRLGKEALQEGRIADIQQRISSLEQVCHRSPAALGGPSRTTVHSPPAKPQRVVGDLSPPVPSPVPGAALMALSVSLYDSDDKLAPQERSSSAAATPVRGCVAAPGQRSSVPPPVVAIGSRGFVTGRQSVPVRGRSVQTQRSPRATSPATAMAIIAQQQGPGLAAGAAAQRALSPASALHFRGAGPPLAAQSATPLGAVSPAPPQRWLGGSLGGGPPALQGGTSTTSTFWSPRRSLGHSGAPSSASAGGASAA